MKEIKTEELLKAYENESPADSAEQSVSNEITAYSDFCAAVCCDECCSCCRSMTH